MVSRGIHDLSAQISALDRKLEIIMTDLSGLKAQVQQISDVEKSAVALINGLSSQLASVRAQLAAQGADTSALADLQSSLAASANDLAAAVTANTRAAPGGNSGAQTATGGDQTAPSPSAAPAQDTGSETSGAAQGGDTGVVPGTASTGP